MDADVVPLIQISDRGGRLSHAFGGDDQVKSNCESFQSCTNLMRDFSARFRALRSCLPVMPVVAFSLDMCGSQGVLAGLGHELIEVCARPCFVSSCRVADSGLRRRRLLCSRVMSSGVSIPYPLVPTAPASPAIMASIECLSCISVSVFLSSSKNSPSPERRSKQPRAEWTRHAGFGGPVDWDGHRLLRADRDGRGLPLRHVGDAGLDLEVVGVRRLDEQLGRKLRLHD